jgi:hypothetical protein
MRESRMSEPLWQKINDQPVVRALNFFGGVGQSLSGVGALVAGGYVAWQYGSKYMLGPLAAVLTAFAAFVCLRIALDPDWAPRAAMLLKQKLGYPILPAPTVLPHQPAAPKEPTASEQLSMLWLVKREFKEFQKHATRAEGMVQDIKAGFEAVKAGGYIADGKTLDNCLDEFTIGLLTCDAIYRNCFRIDANMSLTSPYIRSHHPIEGMDRLPDDRLKHDYRKFHDRLNSMMQEMPKMRNFFLTEINDLESAISRIAENAIRRRVS